ncbi:ankyrin repeat-containing domain protein [Aspergillus karnatakaensis]|uniref:ankyrin repeat-containing domain protein n=1 Tax=Aspergillus karnatakaensis TaxID=1810916 RepID=UPI003CCDF130
MAENEWEIHKTEIESLYIDGKKTLAQVKDHMWAKGFRKSKSQYERQFKKWGLQKYQKLPSTPECMFIARRVEKRKRVDGKESEVIVHNEPYPPEKIRKLQYSKAYISAIEKFSIPVPFPPTPEGILVRTPASPMSRGWFDPFAGFMRLTWSTSLPWLRFCKLVQPETYQESNLLSPASRPPWSREIITQPLATKVELMQRLRRVVPWMVPPAPLDTDIGLRISATLSILMPEEYEGQHQALVTNRLILELYMLSNSLSLQDTYDRTDEPIQSQDKRIISMFRSLGSVKMQQFARLAEKQEPTVESIAEKVFASAVRLHDVGVTRLMLQAGIDPNNLVKTASTPVTPLAWAAHLAPNEGLKLVEALLSYKARVNKRFQGQTAMLPAILTNNITVISVFLRHGAIVPLAYLAEAARIVDLDLFKDLFDACGDVYGLYPECLLGHNGWYGYFHQRAGHDGMTTILGGAAKSGRPEIIGFILQECPALVNPDIVNPPERYISPLELAVAMNHTECLHTLIISGVNLKVTEKKRASLTERASRLGNMKGLQILLAYGAEIDRPSSEVVHHSSALFEAIRWTDREDNIYPRHALETPDTPETSSFELVDLLIKHNARLNDWYFARPGGVLGAAIYKGDVRIIDRLVQAGASELGLEFWEIGSKDAAVYLSRVGMLHKILETHGATILTNAIWGENLDLAEWLIHRNALSIMSCVPTDLDTLLDAAASTGSVAWVKSILQRGARVTDQRLTELVQNIEAGNGNYDVLWCLLRQYRGSAPTAAANAAFFRRADLLQLILDAGISPDGVPTEPTEGWEGWDTTHSVCTADAPQSALDLAIYGGSRECLDILLGCHSWSPVLIGRAFALAIHEDKKKMAEDLYQLNPNMNEEMSIYAHDLSRADRERTWKYNIERFTALQAAIKRQNIFLARELVETHRIDVNYPAIGAFGRTAFQHAVGNGNLELMNMLLTYGADVNAPPAPLGGATALQLAAIKGYCGIARKLIDLGANVNARGAEEEGYGRTALEGAAEHGRIDMLHLLLQEHASVFDDGGGEQCREAVELAKDNGHYAAAKLIESLRPDYIELAEARAASKVWGFSDENDTQEAEPSSDDEDAQERESSSNDG